MACGTILCYAITQLVYVSWSIAEKNGLSAILTHSMLLPSLPVKCFQPTSPVLVK